MEWQILILPYIVENWLLDTLEKSALSCSRPKNYYLTLMFYFSTTKKDLTSLWFSMQKLINFSSNKNTVYFWT